MSRFILPFQSVFDKNGHPLDGAKLYFYETGTSTPKDTYSNVARTTANANPVIANSQGDFGDIFLNGDYRVELKDKNDVTQPGYPEDDISTPDSGLRDDLISDSGSTLIKYDQDDTGSVGRSISSKLKDSVSVFDFMTTAQIEDVRSNAGSINVWAAVVSAIAAAGSIYFPEGVYLIDGSPIDVRAKQLLGDGISITVLETSGTNAKTTMFYNTKDTTATWGSGGGIVIRDMTIRGSWDGSTSLAADVWDDTAALLKFGAGANVKLSNVRFERSYGHGASFYRLGYSRFDNCDFTTNAREGLVLEGPSASDGITSTTISGGTCNSNRGYGNIRIVNGVGLFIRGVTLEDSLCGVYLDGSGNRNVTFLNNHCESCDTNGFIYYVGAGYNINIVGNFYSATSAIQRTNIPFQEIFSLGNAISDDNIIETGIKEMLVETKIDVGNTGSGEANVVTVLSDVDPLFKTVSPHQGFLGTLGGIEFAQLTGQYGYTGPRITGLPEGTSAQDRFGLCFKVRLGVSDIDTDIVYMMRGGDLIPAIDNVGDLGTNSFFDGATNVNKRWNDVYATNATIQTSDERLKKDIKTSELGMDFINALRPVEYKWKDPSYKLVDIVSDSGEVIGSERIEVPSKRTHYGLIAQEVEQVVTDLGIDVADFAPCVGDPDDETISKGLRYQELIAPLIKAVQHLSKEIEILKKQ